MKVVVADTQPFTTVQHTYCSNSLEAMYCVPYRTVIATYGVKAALVYHLLYAPEY
jgi:hypothetical protein